MRLATIGPVLLIGLMATSKNEAASILYSTTDLGSGFFKTLTNLDGSTYGLTTADGGVTYAFDKSPTTTINVQTLGPVNGNGSDAWQTLTLQNGSYRVGYDTDINFSDNQKLGTGNAYVYPSFGSHDGLWYTLGGPINPPILDMNSQGQVVGKSLILGANPNLPNSYFATFSAVGALPHGGDASITDNLNNYIATIPGVTLTSAFQIDDLGRIIATGSNGEDYLLTPASLGGVATVPEPAALATLGAGVLIFLARAIRRRHRIE